MRRMTLLVGVTALVSMAGVGAVGCGSGSDSSIGRTYRDAAGNTCDEGDAHFGDEWSKSGLDVHEVWCRSGHLTAINDNGQVVGTSIVKVPRGTQYHAFVWRNGVRTDLGTLHGDNESIATAINSKGQIVGYSTAKNGQTHAVLWTLHSG